MKSSIFLPPLENCGRICLAIIVVLFAFSASVHAQSKVTIGKKGDQYQLLVDGQPFFINGAGGNAHLSDLVDLGGNSFRTWGIEDLTKQVDGVSVIDRAQKLGLKITVGLWLAHPGRINYADPQDVQKQRDAVLKAVRTYKNNPAVLIWGLGNEMEGPMQDGSDLRVWEEVNSLAEMIKKEDPNHPVMTVIAGVGGVRIKNMASYCPNVDILGVNSYAGGAGAGAAATAAGWTKPFILTEFGPAGDWEVPKTSWGAPLEPTANEKAASYYATQKLVTDDNKNTCLGTYVFLWGNKQECTSTWFGMFLSSGERLPQVDAMSYAWRGKWPEHRCPKIVSFKSSLDGATVAPDSPATATVVATDPNGGTLEYDWDVVEETKVNGVGGEAEPVPPSHPECLSGASGPIINFKAPTTPGAYRLFLTVHNGGGTASTANLPFLVQ